LAFAGINQNAPLLGDIDTRNDGVLTAIEVLDLKLSGTKLVVLSACETGLGEIHEGEGVYGLRRAFQEAGVSEVVNSLWEVSDAGTQALMVKFYQRILAGIPARQGLARIAARSQSVSLVGTTLYLVRFYDGWQLRISGYHR
jgi:CHAT domain-containing protein